MNASRQPISRREWTQVLLAGTGTLVVILLVGRTEEIGERIPFLFLALSAGSATMAALVFLRTSTVPLPPGTTPEQGWAHKMRLTSLGLLPLTLVPLLEMRRSDTIRPCGCSTAPWS